MPKAQKAVLFLIEQSVEINAVIYSSNNLMRFWSVSSKSHNYRA